MRIAALLMIAGFVLMALAWNSAAETGAVARQIPYLLSGTFPGLGLVLLGGVIALVVEFRRAASEMASRVEEALGSVGHDTPRGLTAVPTDGSAVVAGRTTYHVPSCRLVEGRSDLQVMSPADAIERGLAPCRICEPPGEAPTAPVSLPASAERESGDRDRDEAAAAPVVRKVTRAKKATAKRAKKTAKKAARKQAKKAAKAQKKAS